MIRATVKIKAFGPSLSDIVESLTEEWAELVGDYEAVLPPDSEIFVEREDNAELFTATCTIRTKVSE